MMSQAKRTRRQVQAEQTREEILRAARRLFASQGYTATTVSQIAEAAGVSNQTIYDSVGPKAALVTALNDHIDSEANIGELVSSITEDTTAEEMVAVAVAITRGIVETSGDIIRTATYAGPNVSELRAVVDEGIRRHREGVGRLTSRIYTLGRIRSQLSLPEATGTIAALTDATFWIHLIDAYQWSLDRVAQWATEAVSRLVLTESS